MGAGELQEGSGEYVNDTEILEGLTNFIIEFSEQTSVSSGHTWWVNKSAQIIAIDMYRVLEIFREKHPEARVHVVRRQSPAKEIYIDRA